jgi:hypothetical protein
VIRAFIIAICLAATTCVHAQSDLVEAREKAAETLRRLDEKWRKDRSNVTFSELSSASPTVWASADERLILRLQNLWISTALRERDALREIRGRVLAFLLTLAIDGPSHGNAAWASLGLGAAYLKKADEMRDGAHYALVNALAEGEALERRGKGNDESVQTTARAYALLGQSLLQENRPGPAIYHLQKAYARSQGAQFSSTQRDGVALLLSRALDAHRRTQAPDSSIECLPTDLRDAARLRECVALGDLLWSRGDLAGVENLFARMTRDVECGSVDAGEVEALSSLHFARAILYGPDSDVMSFTVCGLSGHLNAVGKAEWAAVVAWPLLHAHIKQNSYEQRLADVAAHTARRLLRDANDAQAWLALKTTMAYFRQADNANDNSSQRISLRRRLIQPALAFDMAYFAERNDWPGIRDHYLKIGESAVERIDAREIDVIYDALSLFFNENYGFKTPTPVAAMELFARIARNLPADHLRHQQAIVIWPNLEKMYRNDIARAARVASDNLSNYRRLPKAAPTAVALLLQGYAEMMNDAEPDKAREARREALELLIDIPSQLSTRIDLLFEMERDRRELGDSVGAVRYFEEAVALRREAPSLDPRTMAKVDMRLALLMFNEGNPAVGRTMAERAFAMLLEATQADDAGWTRMTHAQTLAELYAAEGDIVRARRLFEEHIFPFSDRPIAAGEGEAIRKRLDLARLEALYGPTAKTVATIRNLMTTAQRRASAANDIIGNAWRSLAIAYLGLDEGLASLDAARRAFALKPALASLSAEDQADRRLSETFVSAAWRAERAAASRN